MNKQEFFTLLVGTANKHYTNPTVGSSMGSGQHFSMITSNGSLKFMSLSQEVMDEVFEKFVSKEATGGYDFRPFLIPNCNDVGVIFVEEISPDFSYNDYTIGGLDTIEILVDANDSTKYLIVNEGDEIVNTAGITMDINEDSCVFWYEGTSFELKF